jgi:hypothetical protein
MWKKPDLQNKKNCLKDITTFEIVALAMFDAVTNEYISSLVADHLDQGFPTCGTRYHWWYASRSQGVRR